jgi:hypothetical protein
MIHGNTTRMVRASNTELRNSSTVGRFSGKTSELTPENGAALLKEHLSKWD